MSDCESRLTVCQEMRLPMHTSQESVDLVSTHNISACKDRYDLQLTRRPTPGANHKPQQSSLSPLGRCIPSVCPIPLFHSPTAESFVFSGNFDDPDGRMGRQARACVILDFLLTITVTTRFYRIFLSISVSSNLIDHNGISIIPRTATRLE